MLIDAHLHLDKYGDLLDEALKQIETERICTVATAMDVPSYLELRKIGERSELVLPTANIVAQGTKAILECLRVTPEGTLTE